MWTFGTAAMSEGDEENVPNVSRRNAGTSWKLWSAGRGGGGVRLKRKGSLGKNQLLSCYRMEECSLRDKFRDGVTLSGRKKWEDGGKKVQGDPKDVRRY